MSLANKKESDWSVEFVEVLRSERVDKKNRIDLRIVKWARADRPVLEKRRVWEREDGDRPTKMVGLDLDDVKYIYEHYPYLINLL